MQEIPHTYWERIVFLLQNYWLSFLGGAGNTLLIAVIATAAGVLIGLLVGVIMTVPEGRNKVGNFFIWLVKKVLFIYIEIFRGTPMMVQAMFMYFGAVMYLGYNPNRIIAGIVIVSINTGAYMAETVRGGIISINDGQTEGAKAIGMTHTQTMLNVIMPQAMRNIMPQIGNNLIINIKDTSVLNVISVTELYFAGKSVAGMYLFTFETFTIVSVMYLIMTVTCARLLRFMENKMAGSDSYDLATQDTLAYTSGMTNFPNKKKDKRGEK